MRLYRFLVIASSSSFVSASKQLDTLVLDMLQILFEPRHEKTCFCPMRTTKAQISLRGSAPLLFAT